MLTIITWVTVSPPGDMLCRRHPLLPPGYQVWWQGWSMCQAGAVGNKGCCSPTLAQPQQRDLPGPTARVPRHEHVLPPEFGRVGVLPSTQGGSRCCRNQGTWYRKRVVLSFFLIEVHQWECHQGACYTLQWTVWTVSPFLASSLLFRNADLVMVHLVLRMSI